MPPDSSHNTPQRPAGPRPTRPVPPKKKSLLEWIMLSIGLSYGDEGEDKWTRHRPAAARDQDDGSPNQAPNERRQP